MMHHMGAADAGSGSHEDKVSRQLRRANNLGTVVQRHGKFLARVGNGYGAQGQRLYVYSQAYTSRAEAERDGFLDAYRRRDIKNAQAAEQVIEQVQGPSVSGWVEQWVGIQSLLRRPKTMQNDASAARKWLAGTSPTSPKASQAFGRKLLSQVAVSDWRTIHAAIRAAGRSETTVNNVSRLARQIWADAVREGLSVPQHLLIATIPEVAPSARRALDVTTEVRWVLAALRGQPLIEQVRWGLALWLGARQGDVLGLSLDRLELETPMPTVRFDRQLDSVGRKQVMPPQYRPIWLRPTGPAWALVPTKTSLSRAVPLLPHLVELLQQYLESEWVDNQWAVDPATGQPISLLFTEEHRGNWPGVGPRRDKYDRDQWRAIQALAGVSRGRGAPFDGHELRHTTVSLLTAAGVDQSVRMAIVGHESERAHRGYTHVAPATMLVGLEAMAELIG